MPVLNSLQKEIHQLRTLDYQLKAWPQNWGISIMTLQGSLIFGNHRTDTAENQTPNSFTRVPESPSKLNSGLCQFSYVKVKAFVGK